MHPRQTWFNKGSSLWPTSTACQVGNPQYELSERWEIQRQWHTHAHTLLSVSNSTSHKHSSAALLLRGRLWQRECAHVALLCSLPAPLSFLNGGKVALPVGGHWNVYEHITKGEGGGAGGSLRYHNSYLPWMSSAYKGLSPASSSLTQAAVPD